MCSGLASNTKYKASRHLPWSDDPIQSLDLSNTTLGPFPSLPRYLVLRRTLAPGWLFLRPTLSSSTPPPTHTRSATMPQNPTSGKLSPPMTLARHTSATFLLGPCPLPQTLSLAEGVFQGRSQWARLPELRHALSPDCALDSCSWTKVRHFKPIPTFVVYPLVFCFFVSLLWLPLTRLMLAFSS